MYMNPKPENDLWWPSKQAVIKYLEKLKELKPKKI